MGDPTSINLDIHSSTFVVVVFRVNALTGSSSSHAVIVLGGVRQVSAASFTEGIGRRIVETGEFPPGVAL